MAEDNVKKIRDLEPITDVSKDHLVPLSTPIDDPLKSTVHATTSNLFGAMINDSSSFELDSNGNLKIKPGSIDSESIAPGGITADNLAPGSTATATSETLTDINGVIRTIESSAGGFLAVRVSIDGAGGEEGPNPRVINQSSISGANIFAPNHGLNTGQTVKLSGDVPIEINSGENYTVTVIDADNISIDGVSSYTIDPSKSFILSRDIFIAFDAVDFKSGSNPHYVACVNFEFSSFSQAYRWFVRYGQGTSKLILLAGMVCPWSDSDVNARVQDSFNIGGGKNFEYLTQLSIWGNLVSSSGIKAIGREGATNQPAAASLTRCRIIVDLTTSDDGLPIWFRIFGSVYIENVTFDYRIATGNSISLATGMRCSHGLYSLINVSMVIWSSGTTDPTWLDASNWEGTNQALSTGVTALEGGQIYFLAGYALQYGFGSIGVCSSIGPSKIVVGTPNTIEFQVFGQTTVGGNVGSAQNLTLRSVINQTLTANSTVNNDGSLQNSGFGDAQQPGTVGAF